MIHSGFDSDDCWRRRRCPHWQISKSASAINMMPQLGADHTGQSHVQYESLKRDFAALLLNASGPFHTMGIKQPRLRSGLGAEQLIDPCRSAVAQKRAGKVGSEHRLGPVRDLLRQDSFGGLTQQSFIRQTLQF